MFSGRRNGTAGGPYTTITDNVTVTSYTDDSLTNGTTYYYVVSAINASGESANSNEASTTPQAPALGGRALLELTMTNGAVKEYDLSATDVNTFLNWYDARSNGTGLTYIALSKAYLNGPFVNRKEYVSFDKIFSFEIMEY